MKGVLEKKLNSAICDGDLEGVKRLLESTDDSSPDGLDVLSDQFEFMLLCRAVEWQRPDIVELFLAKGFKVNLKTSDELKATALHIATRKGNAKIVRQLLNAGADMSVKDVCGFTAFHDALERGRVEIVKIFLDFGANVNSREFCFGTAADEAMKLENVNTFDLIVNAGGQWTIGIQDPITFLFEAVKRGKTTTVELLLKNGVDLQNSKDRDGLDLLSCASRYSNATIIKLLVDQGLDINKGNNSKFLCKGVELTRLTALHHATNNPDSGIIDTLIELGATINQGNASFSAVHFAALNNQTEVIKKFIIQHGADINSPDTEWRIPLHYAAIGKSYETAKFLLESGSHFINWDTFSRTPLDYAAQICTIDLDINVAQGKVVELVKLFLNHGTFASENSKYCHMISALNIVASDENLVGMQFLLHCGIPIELIRNPEQGFNALHYSVSRGNVAAVEILLNYGVDVNMKSTCGLPPILSAISIARPAHSLRIFNYLLGKGADVINARSNRNSSPLHCAVEMGNKEIIKQLFKLGVDINATNNFGNTALHYVKDYAILEILIGHGASINIENNRGRTAVHLVLTDQKWTGYFERFLRILCYLHDEGVRMMSENDLELIKSSPEMKAIFDKCYEELKSMRSEKFGNSTVSLYDIFRSKSARKLASLLRNNNIASYFRSLELIVEKYPQYYQRIIDNFNKGSSRLRLLNRVKNFFGSLFDGEDNRLPILPSTFTSEVFNCLSNSDLCALSKAY